MKLTLFLAIFISGVSLSISQLVGVRIWGQYLGFSSDIEAIALTLSFGALAIGYVLPVLWRRWSSFLSFGLVSLLGGMVLTLGTMMAFGEGDGFRDAENEKWMLLVFLSTLLCVPSLTSGFAFTVFIDSSKRSIWNLAPAMIYAFYTIGGGLGLGLFSFLLVPNFGISGTVMINLAITCSIVVVGILCFVLNAQASQNRNAPVKISTNLLYTAAFNGFLIGIVEITSIRMLALSLNSSTFAYSIVALVFVVGLGAGSGLSTLMPPVEKGRLPLARYATAGCLYFLGIALFVMATQMNFVRSNILYSMLALFPSSLALGTVLPTLWTFTSGEGESSGITKIGLLTSISTASMAAGMLAGGAFLIPLFGLWYACALTSAVLILSPFIISDYRTNSVLKFTTLSGLVLIGIFAFLADNGKWQVRKSEKILFHENSPYGLIDVIENQFGNRRVRQNYHYTLGGTASKKMELRQGLIPLLLKDKPNEILFIGLGTGITASAALGFDIKEIDVAEINPSVVAAARYFREYTNNFLDQSNVTVAVADGRAQLMSQPKLYGAIVTDLFVPWEAKTGYLFSKQFYQIAESRIREDGMFVQWLPLWQLTEKQFRIIANTFSSAFSRTSLLWGRIQNDKSMLALVGAKVKATVRMERIRAIIQKMPSLQSDEYFNTPQPFCDLYVGDWSHIPTDPINSYNDPIIEFDVTESTGDGANRLTFSNFKQFSQEQLSVLKRANIYCETVTGDSSNLEVSRAWQSYRINSF